MSSKTSHTIKQRKISNDVFITPLALAKSHIDMITPIDGETWLDSCKNDGSYYNQFPNEKNKQSIISFDRIVWK